MFIYLLILIPIIFTIIAFLKFKHEVVWWEYLLNFAVAFICIFAAKAIIEHAQVTDTEYLGGWTTEVRHYEDWNEYIHRTCTKTVSCGKDCSRTVYYDCSYVDYHPQFWELRNSNGSKIRISQLQYNKLVTKFGTGKQFVDLRRNYHNNDGDMYNTKWSGTDATLEPTITEHSYENRVRVSSSTFAMQEPPEEIFEEYNLFHYPKVVNNYQQKAILGYDDPKAERLVQLLNAKLGRSKEFRTYIMIFKGHGREAGMYQEEQWQGSNKNELNITIGLDENDNVKWCHIFSWTDERKIVVDVKDFIEEQEKLDLSAIVNFLYGEVEKDWVRKDFDDFTYLSVEPETHHIIIAFIITLIINGLVSWYVIANDVTEGGRNSYRRR